MGRKPVTNREIKKCPKCKEVKPAGGWYKNQRQPDGLSGWCKDCTKDYQDQNRDRLLAWSRDYQKSERRKQVEKKYLRSEKGKAARRIIKARKYNMDEDFRKRVKARTSVQNEIKAGRLPPVQTRMCIRCNSQAEQYHHHNGYDDAHRLDVIPTCKECHRELEKTRLDIANNTPLV